MDKDKVHIFLLTSGKPCVYLFMLFLLVTSKKSKFLKSITCLGKAIPCTFYILFFSFLQINLFFVQIGLHVTSTFPLSIILSVLFLLFLLVQTVYLHDVPGKHFGKYRGLLFLLFLQKSTKSNKKALISKPKVFLMC